MLSVGQPVFSQDRCNLVFSGRVFDAETALPVAGALISIDTTVFSTSNEEGFFVFTNLCEGHHHVVIKHLGFKTQFSYMIFSENLKKDFLLETESKELESVVVTGIKKVTDILSLPVAILSGKELDKVRGFSLGETLKSIPGVNSIQTGPSISKPVIHGLYGNRILILNNGVRMEGQQWGSDHAPEIDPFVATKLSVIKGPASIIYGSDAIGGIVLVDLAPLLHEPGVKGEVNLVGMSNNKMGVGSGILEGAFGKKLRGLSWRAQGTIRRAGNSKTAEYYMDNTGFKEEDFSVSLGYKKVRYGVEIFFSDFYTKLGIFSGAEVGSISDLIAAINRPKPLTPDVFSYATERPYQEVNHTLLKAKAFYNTSENGKLEFTYARQQNERSEYDYLPYSGTQTPQLYLNIVSHTADLSFQHKLFHNMSGKAGLSGLTQSNARMYEYLIPDFKNYGGGFFLLEKWSKNKLLLEAGIRYDYRWLQAYLIDNATAQITSQVNVYNNFSGSLGSVYELTEKIKWRMHLGTAWRAPTVSELYSNGVHQGAASYEKGTQGLQAEQSYQISTSMNYTGKKLTAEIELYNNVINNYIYLKPDLSFVQTARGSYPSFTYTATDAVFRGIDLQVDFHLLRPLSFISKTSLIWAENLSIHDYLIYIPANRFDNTLVYEFKKLWKLESFFVSLSDCYVSAQNHVPQNSDYALPPPAYNLIAANLGFDFPAGHHKISISVGVNNLLNISYRDYLNRFRYFTDDLGRNVIIRAKIPFSILTKK